MEIDVKKFKRLPLALRYKNIEEHGVYLSRRKYLNYNIELFSFHGFYAEVWRTNSVNQVVWIEFPVSSAISAKYVGNDVLKELLR
jgi:hypothetical protein